MKRAPRIFIALQLVALLLVAGCTTRGLGFPDPLGEVTLDGLLYSANSRGLTVFWGTARNTGDVEVENIIFVIDVYSGGGRYFGQFRGLVSKGFVEDEVDSTLAVDETGSFIIHTSVPFGAVARVEHHAEFTILVPEED